MSASLPVLLSKFTTDYAPSGTPMHS